MRKVWHRANPESYEKLKWAVQAQYPHLTFHEEERRVLIRGSFPLTHEGKLLDRYIVEIEIPPDYPDSLPVVRETAGRIPHTADRHMNRNGEACLFVPDERSWVLPPGATFLEFLNGPVYSFFLGQTFVEMGQEWPFGQRSHGNNGILEFYSEKIGTKNSEIIIRYLELLSKREIKGHWDCPCGSRKRLRDCHLREVRDLRSKIPPDVARRSWSAMRGEKASTM